MPPTPLVLITGHPAAGKTTLARYLGKALGWPALCKDDIKEVLYDTLDWSTAEQWQQLSVATWTLLYHQVTVLLDAHTPHIVEANFVPKFANPQWQVLKQRFEMQVIQVRCEGDPATLVERYRARIQQGQRHPGHRDGGDDPAFHALLHRGPMAWVEVESERISVDTTKLAVEGYGAVAAQVRALCVDGTARAGGAAGG